MNSSGSSDSTKSVDGDPSILGPERTGHHDSPGPVLNNECIGRGVFERDQKKLPPDKLAAIKEPDTRFKMGLVALRQLRERQFSVYRDLAERQTHRTAIVEKIKKSKPEEVLVEILWANAGAIRALLGPRGSPDIRIYLVIDDVICDRFENTHRLHVNVGYTDQYAAQLDLINEKDDPPAIYAREQLLVLLSREADVIVRL